MPPPQVAVAAQRIPGVEWLGRKPLPEVYALLGRAKCLVFPSKWYETFGRVTIEAFAKGTPVLAADIGAIAEIVEPVIRTRTTAEWLECLPPHGVWAAPVLNYDGLFAHPVMQGADVTEEVDHPVAGRVRLLRFPLEFSSGRADVRRLPPASGEHTDEILQELGYTQVERTHFRHGKVV